MFFSKIPAKSHRRYQRPTDRRAVMMLQLEDLESRVLLAATQLVIQVQPSQTALGTPMFPAIQVAVADPNQVTVTTDTSTVVLSVLAGPFGGSLTMGGTPTLTASVKAINGVATFSNINFTTTGVYELSVNDGNLAGTASNFFNVTAAAAKLVFTQPPTTITAGTPFSPAIAAWVEDAGGNLVTSDRSAVTLAIVSGPAGGVLTGTTTVNAVTGVAIFNGVSLSKAGNYKLQVQDGSLTAAQSNTFTVSAGASAKLVFAQQPVNTPGGTVLPAVIVNVTDSSGSILTTDNSAVTLTISPTTGTMTGTVTVNAVNGVATFTGLSINQLGNYTLRATDGSFTAGVSNSFAITGAPDKLVFLGVPPQTTAGAVMTPGVIVAVEDVNGNIVETDFSSVTLAIGSGPGTLSGTTTVAAVNGTATFNDLSLSVMGTYTLTASDGTLTGATSSSFVINGTAAQLAFLVQPTSPSVNSRIAPAVVVEVEDSAGNRVVNDASAVAISLASGPGTLSGTTTAIAVNGTASFSSLTLSAAGTYTLAATVAGLPGAISNAFVVLPPPSKLLFVTQPSNVAMGAAMYPAVVVQVQNDLGLLAPTDTSSVTLAILDGPANASIGGTTTVAAVAGVATFNNLNFSVSGQYTLEAYDGALATDTSVPFVVAGRATKLLWGAQPTQVAAGTGITVSAVVDDKDSNRITTDHSVVTLAISSGPTGGKLVGNATVNADSGVATFNNVSFTVAGKYVLTVTDGSLTAAISHLILVVPDTASSHLVVAQNPATTLVGKTFASNVVVDVADQFGNIITSDGSPVTAFISRGPGGRISGSTTVNAKGGVATFSNLSIDQAGSYTLKVSDSTLNNVTMPTFTLNVSQVISSVSKPATSSTYAANQAFSLTTQIKGVVASASPWTGTADLVDLNNAVLPTAATVNTNGGVTLIDTGLTAGTYTVRVRYSGDVNHLGGVSPAFNLVVGAATTTAVTPTTTQVDAGAGLSLNVRVGTAGSAAAARAGAVQLLEGTTVVASSNTFTNSQATLMLPTTTAVGNHTYTVAYSGNNNFRGSVSSAVNVAVGKTTTTAAAPSATHISRGDTLILNLHIGTPGTTLVPTGSAQLMEGGVVIKTTSLNGTQGSFTLTPTVGTHSYTVVYPGDNIFLGSTSTVVKVTVAQTATTTGVTRSPTTAQITLGTPFTLNVVVAAVNGATIARTGQVLLKEGNTVLSVLSLDGNSSALFSLLPAVGNHTYTVTYLGDANFKSSTASVVKLTVTAV